MKFKAMPVVGSEVQVRFEKVGWIKGKIRRVSRHSQPKKSIAIIELDMDDAEPHREHKVAPSAPYVPPALKTTESLWSLFAHRQAVNPDMIEVTLLVVLINSLADVGMHRPYPAQ